MYSFCNQCYWAGPYLVGSGFGLLKYRMLWPSEQNLFVINNVAPLFWAAPEVRGLGADSGSDQIGSAPARGKKDGSRRLRLHTLNFCHFELFNNTIFDHIYFYKLLLSHIRHNNKAFLLCLPKRCSWSRLKEAAPALGSDQQKNRLRLKPKSCCSRQFRNRNMGQTLALTAFLKAYK